MSTDSKRKPFVVPMRGRSPDEAHRASTPLELLFDLVFVVAVALASARLHHSIVEHHVGQGLLSYVMVFFAIWWAWMNFSWFASAYDTDDVPYRLLVMVQLAGALVLAAGVPAAFDEGKFQIITLGYSIMRLALLVQWARAWRNDVPRRKTISRYMIGMTLTQLAWLALLFVPAQYKLIGFSLLVLTEFVTPTWAESAGRTPFHPEHMVERYGLFTIIVLGESILSASTAVQASVDIGRFDGFFIQTVIGAVLIVFNMWWTYFQQTEHNFTVSAKSMFAWGYGHFFIFASAAAVGAGLAAYVDFNTAGQGSTVLANAAVAVPVVVFMLSIGLIHRRMSWGNRTTYVSLLCFAAIAACIWSDSAVLYIGLIMSAFMAYKLALTKGK